MVRISVRNFHDSSSGMATDLRSSDEEMFGACGGEVFALPRANGNFESGNKD